MKKCTRCGAAAGVEARNYCPNCGASLVDANDPSVVAEKDRVAKRLAQKHYEVEPGLTRIVRFSGNPSIESSPNEPIKLLEVNAETVSSGIMPLHFGPALTSGIIFPSVIIEVTPEEYQKIESKELNLPSDWEFSEELPKPNTV